MTTFGIHHLEFFRGDTAACAGCRNILFASGMATREPINSPAEGIGSSDSPVAWVFGDWWLVRYDIDEILEPLRDPRPTHEVNPRDALQFSGPYCSRACAHTAAVGNDQMPAAGGTFDTWFFCPDRATEVDEFICWGCGWEPDVPTAHWLVLGFIPGDPTPMTLVAPVGRQHADEADIPQRFCCEACAAQAALDAHVGCLA